MFTGPKGLTVAMRNGLLAYFGDASRPHAKWLSLAQVLADPSSAGASYIDVRLPARPAAGFPAGVLPPAASTSAVAGSSEQPGGSSESTVASLAAGLADGNGEASQATGAPASTSSPGSSPSASSSEPAAGGAGQTAPGAEAEGAQAGVTPGGQQALNLDWRFMPSRAILRQWSRVRRSATIVARLDDIVDRAKFPA